VVAHSPTPSIVSTTASSNGDGKNALAAWLWWCSPNRSLDSQSKSGRSLQLLLEQLFWKSFSFSHSGMAMRNDWNPGRERQVGLQQPLELQERLVVEDHVVDLAELDAASLRQ
jgi:hypothetical protein